jgi:elongator complex protein 6
LIFIDGLGLSHSNSGTDSSSTISSLDSISTAVADAVSTIDNTSDVLLILDSPDILMGLGSIDHGRILDSILKWRHQVHSMVISLTADFVVDMAAQKSTSSKMLGNQQQLLLALAHQADNIFSTKLLDSGSAKDVSGVVRIHPRRSSEDIKEKELLYFIDSGSNKGVEIWERGGLRK